jgi:hypothetical protein
MRISIANRLGKVSAALGLALFLCASGCHVKKPVEQTFYEEHIQTIFTQSCVNGTSPCHRVDPQTGVALGNLDLSSFEAVQKRRDVLRTYANYPQPLLLLKVLPEEQVQIPYQGRLFHSEIKHAGGKPISSNSDAFFDLKRWLDNGANKDGILPVQGPNTGKGDCQRGAVPDGWTPPPGLDRASLAYQTFGEQIMPKIRASCAFGTCHASPQADFYMTCGDNQAQMDFNFVTAVSFVVPDGTAVEQSEILLRPLSARAGGINHTGGVFFQSRDDGDWVKWRDWAGEVQTFRKTHVLDTETRSAGRQFFEANVMPKLLQRGCALEGCHSPNGFNDFRLRPGAQGFLSSGALKRNYESALGEFMALDSVDVRQGRLVKKTLFTSGAGITHRGGALLEDEETSSADACPTFPMMTYDGTKKFNPQMPADPTSSRALCLLAEWHRIERADRAAAVSTMASGETVPLAFVSRPPNDDNLLQFDTYRGGADLKLADATMGMNGAVASVANVRSGLTTCAGLTGKDVDVRGPEWSYDGTKVVFAARPGAGAGLDLWLLDVAGGTCKQLTTDNGRMVNGVVVHNFDPVFAPDGSVVFASTRAGTRTLKTFLPNSDLFRSGPNMNFANVQQMTFLLNSEVSPAFMQDGRVSFTAEKATPEFYQVSGRRINWDLTDYHPLLAQRANSTDTFSTDMHPSVGYQQATEIREGLDRNFLIILSDVGARGGGGALATFNRSIGPFEADRTEATFLRSMIVVDPAATGRMGTVGVYRSPFSLPNGEILASYAANVTNPAAQTPKFDLVAVNEKTGARRPLASDAALSYVEAALGYKRAETQLFHNVPQLVFGGQAGAGADALGTLHFPDLPLLSTLLGANLRHGRNVQDFDRGVGLKVYLEEPPPPTASPTSPPAGLMGSQMVFSQRTVLGHVPLRPDKSIKVNLPANKPVILELIDGNGAPVFTMTEEHQVTAGEYTTPGAPRGLFNGICGGCHGSITGAELDVSVTADALTGASVSMSRDADPLFLQN